MYWIDIQQSLWNPVWMVQTAASFPLPWGMSVNGRCPAVAGINPGFPLHASSCGRALSCLSQLGTKCGWRHRCACLTQTTHAFEEGLVTVYILQMRKRSQTHLICSESLLINTQDQIYTWALYPHIQKNRSFELFLGLGFLFQFTFLFCEWWYCCM